LDESSILGFDVASYLAMNLAEVACPIDLDEDYAYQKGLFYGQGLFDSI
jgi:hypothetical protein